MARITDVRSKNIPVVVLEEHHEAFLAWCIAMQKKIFRPGKNVLLHVDHHSDLRLTPFRKPMPGPFSPLEEIRDFVYDELRLNTFIVPALYQESFSSFYWLLPKKQGDHLLETMEYYRVRTLMSERRILSLKRTTSLEIEDDSTQDSVYFTSFASTTEHSFQVQGKIILDIDLDYFCCSKLIDQAQELEITREEYLRCKNERYRNLNFFFRYYLREQDGHYYICLNDNPAINYIKQEYSQEKCLKAIEEFLLFLESNRINPAFITICRSRHSGFTPQSMWHFIEEHLLKGLQSLYQLKINLLDEFYTI